MPQADHSAIYIVYSAKEGWNNEKGFISLHLWMQVSKTSSDDVGGFRSCFHWDSILWLRAIFKRSRKTERQQGRLEKLAE